MEIHNRVKKMYSWSKVAKETTAVYNKVLAEQQHNPKTFLQRMECYSSIGGIAGWVASILALLIHFWAATVEWWQPREHIDVVPDLQSEVNKTEESKF